MSSSDRIEKLLLKAEIGKTLSRNEIIELLKMPGDCVQDLFATADRIRQREVGNEIFLCGIIKFSNYCERNCLHCELRKSNNKLNRYRMTDDEIINTAQEIKKLHFPTLTLRSGKDSFYPTNRICRLIEKIKNETGMIITLSIGERSTSDFQSFLQSGANRCHLKQETISPELYKYLRPDSQLDERMHCLHSLKLLGLETGTGNIIGLPGQTLEIIADDLLFMKQLDADMLSIGHFIPHPDTPLAGIENDDIELTLRVMAIARLVTRNTNILAANYLEELYPQGQLLALQAGANTVVLDFTPEIYKIRHDVCPRRTDIGSNKEIISKLEKDLNSIGRTLLYSDGKHFGKNS